MHKHMLNCILWLFMPVKFFLNVENFYIFHFHLEKNVNFLAIADIQIYIYKRRALLEINITWVEGDFLWENGDLRGIYSL